MDSAADPSREVGCPIRKSPDQRSLPSPRSLSQGATSFIASRCQGIHQMPFSSLENLTKIRHAQGQTHPHGRSAHAKHHGCLPPPIPDPGHTTRRRRKPNPEPAKARNISGTTRATRRRNATRAPAPETKTSSRCPRPANTPGHPRPGPPKAGPAAPCVRPTQPNPNTFRRRQRSDRRHCRKRHFAPRPGCRGLRQRPTATGAKAGPESPPGGAGHPWSRPWWSRTESNRRPPACKAGALPTELRPLFRRSPSATGVAASVTAPSLALRPGRGGPG